MKDKKDASAEALKNCLARFGMYLLPAIVHGLLTRKGATAAPAPVASTAAPGLSPLPYLPETYTSPNPNIRPLEMRALRLLKRYADIEAKVDRLRQIHREAVVRGHVESERGWVVAQAGFTPSSFLIRLKLDFYEAGTLLFDVTFDFAIELIMGYVTPMNHAAMELMSEGGFEWQYREMIEESGRG